MAWLLSLKLSTKYASLQKSTKMIRSLILVLLLFSFGTNAMGQNLGSIQRGQRGYSPPAQNRPAGEPEPPDVYLLSQERADMYQEILQIDDFQKEVLKTFLKDHYAKTSAIAFDENLKFENKQKGINAEKKILEKNLLDVFSKEQTESIMSEEQFGSKTKEYKKEKKKEKKRKKKKEKDDG